MSDQIAPRFVRHTPHAIPKPGRFASTRVGEPNVATKTLSYLVLSAATLAIVAPFVYVLLTSLKEGSTLFEYPPKWLPDPFYFGHYVRLLTGTNFPRWIFNSLFLATTVTVLSLAISSAAGYAFAKLEFPGKRIFFGILLMYMMVPFAALVLPLYQIVDAMGLKNNWLAVILPALASPFNIFFVRQFIMGLPGDLENAARLDGVSEFGIFWRIVLPLIRPGLVVLAVIVFTGEYMAFLWPLMILSDSDLQPVTVGLAGMRGYNMVNYQLFSAASLMATVPVAVIFFVLQKQFLARSMAGALKQ
jgi:multiple sugar transport system permease protein